MLETDPTSNCVGPASVGKSGNLYISVPEIDYNFFADPDECKVMVDGIRQARRILAAKAFDDYRGEELEKSLPA